MSDHTQLPGVTTGPLTTFHPFPRLPWELRNEIWKQSIRPLDRPGAHIFCIEERKSEDSEPKECDVICNPIPLESGDSNLHIRVPAATISAGPAGNPSTYMIDGGLWTACKESRAVMERVFRHRMWDPKRRAYLEYMRALQHLTPALEDPYKGLEHETDLMPATGFFLSAPESSSSSSFTRTTKADGPNHRVTTSPHYFSVFPHRDLFIMRPSSWKIKNMWFQLQFGFPLGLKTWGYFGFGGKHGLAFEYDPIWEQEPYSRDHTGKVIIISAYDRMTSTIQQLSLSDTDTVWFIDYRLKLKENTPTDKTEPSDNQKVFYGYDGRRYVEVYSKYVEGGGDRLPWFYTEGLEGEDSSSREGSCHYFIATVEFGLTMEFLNELSENEWDMDDQERHGPALGLLACLR
ncbi:hypothetical protein GE21DRAFT_1207 [Neurospora crassa]|uniref:2EXR domain-containing protein n=1 Tax=Neurospora crassa (strain ATCC 24698 / 74-OR23-1A / CBS 708.71 / DSM 1257 / FGSC 987) TaxID=367110 RepID=Q7SEX0_NEUCR|nr:hypothetical protein NCU03161 [Neurospora crassa OR74A]EAA35331.2 hypothetical protein NCU03161 [Neurospora crassa OR74A]KHE86013.1 hypothetical protein GE21DRAFT_1207 [Neurospora crassa]|eukprot:XP_964567.2 hypothetical protein NCU03161 [Neurospora crassa OR74A]